MAEKGRAGHTVLKELREKHPVFMQFLLFFIVCNGVTVLQLILMPVLKYIFGMTDLVNINFQVLPVGHTINGNPYYIFDYASGSIDAGGGGGLAYFLAVELTMADIVSMLINCTISFWVFFPIMKFIFRK